MAESTGRFVSGGLRDSGASILSTAATGLIEYIALRGGDVDRIVGAVGGSVEALQQTDGRMDLGLFCEIFERAARDTRDIHFGLGYGQQFHPADLGMLGYIALASQTLGAALENMCELFHRHQHNSIFSVARSGDVALVHYRICDKHIAERQQDAELSIGMFVNIFRHFLGTQWMPLAVGFEHAPSGAPREYDRLLGTRVRFNQPSNTIMLRSRDLAQTNPTPDPRLLALLRHNMTLLGLAEQRRESLTERVAHAVRIRLTEGEPTLEDIASDLRMAAWTLQRRLRTEGQTYQDVLSNTRRELALKYLGDLSLPLSELAFMLGYSELSAFSRAFHRWMLSSPSEWRRTRCDPQPSQS